MNFKNIVTLIIISLILALTGCPKPLDPVMLELLKDLDAPEIVIISPADYSEYSTVLELKGTINDLSLENAPEGTLFQVAYRIIGTTISGTIDADTADGSFSTLIDVSELNGDQVIEISAEDLNGNKVVVNVNIRKPADGGDISGFSVTAGNKQAVISWDPVPGAVSYDLNEMAYGKSTAGVTSPYVWSNLENGEIYTFELKANLPEDNGTDAFSSQVSVMPLSIRSLCPALSPDADRNTIKLEWPNIPNISTFTVERRTAPDGTWSTRRLLPKDAYDETGGFIDDEVEYGESYFYRVKPREYPEIVSEACFAAT